MVSMVADFQLLIVFMTVLSNKNEVGRVIVIDNVRCTSQGGGLSRFQIFSHKSFEAMRTAAGSL